MSLIYKPLSYRSKSNTSDEKYKYYLHSNISYIMY